MGSQDPVRLYLEAGHRSSCTYWIFSGDRHCSCGRDEALKFYDRIAFMFEQSKGNKKEKKRMKIIMVGGYPGSGKSVIMRGVIERLEGEGQKFRVQSKGSVRFLSSKDYIILGTYEPDNKFPGTDRFPMNIQPAAQNFMTEARTMYPDKTIIFEGDRLFNDKMIKFLKEQEFDLVLCLVGTEKVVLDKRRKERSEQNETWRKGRESKVDRMAIMYPITHRLANTTKEDHQQSIETLVSELKGESKVKVMKETKLKSLWK